MKNLKLNQLNKQKLVEKEMNAIEGGQAPGGGVVVPAHCVSACTDTQYDLHRPSYDMWGGINSGFAW
jgi:natural product precursor